MPPPYLLSTRDVGGHEVARGYHERPRSAVTRDYHFYNWNRVMIRYCNGSSFTGDIESVDPATNLYYRGERVWLAVIQDLLAKGMSKAENALLSGCSTGGLASILHCDSFHAFFQKDAKVQMPDFSSMCKLIVASFHVSYFNGAANSPFNF